VFRAVFLKAKNVPVPETNISEQEKQDIKAHYAFCKNLLAALDTFGISFLLPHTPHFPGLVAFLSQNMHSVDSETRKVAIRALKLLLLNVVVVREAAT